MKQYASTLLEGLVIAVAFALVDGLRSHVMTSVIAGAAGLVVGVFLGIGIAEHTEKQDTQV